MIEVMEKCFMKYMHCLKSVRIWSFSRQYFPAFRLNTDQKSFEYEHFSCSEIFI